MYRTAASPLATASAEDTLSPTYQQDAPFFLPRMYPPRTAPVVGDVVEMPERGTVLLTEQTETQQGYVGRWLEGWEKGTTTTLAERDLTHQLDAGRARLLADRIESRNQAWWITGETPPQPAIDTGDLTVTQLDSRTRGNRFLEHPLVDHDLGGNATWKVGFAAVAREMDNLVAVAYLDRPARVIDDGQRLTLSRFASHPAAPPNTASWLLARVTEWARLHGYRVLRTHAGVANENEGGIYQASNFTYEGETTTTGKGHTSRDGRQAYSEFTRRTYYRQLSPTAIHVPDPTTDREAVPTPPSHQAPYGTLVADGPDALTSLRPYLKTYPTRQATTLSETPPDGEGTFLSVEDVCLVDFCDNPALADALATTLPVRDRTPVTKPSLAGAPTPAPADTLLRGAPAPTAILGAHDGGELTTLLVIHRADALCAPDALPASLSPATHLVTAFATIGQRGWDNVAAWLLARARDRATFADSTLRVVHPLAGIRPAQRRAGVPSVSLPRVARGTGAIANAG